MENKEQIKAFNKRYKPLLDEAKEEESLIKEMENKTLSDKICSLQDNSGVIYMFKRRDVKEFIKELKEAMPKGACFNCDCGKYMGIDFSLEFIDKLAGEKLI